MKLLASEIAALGADGFDTSLIGFDAAQLNELMKLAMPPVANPEVAPQPPATAVSRQGDCWLLGPHRVACGDSDLRGSFCTKRFDSNWLGKEFLRCPRRGLARSR
jgi:hypothetical protein